MVDAPQQWPGIVVSPAAAPAVGAAPAQPASEWPGVPVGDQTSGVSTAQDVGSSILPALLRGTIGAVTAPATMADLAKRGIDMGLSKIFPGYGEDLAKVNALEEKNSSIPLPTYGNVESAVEKNVTGPLYQAKTPVGKVVETAGEIAPAIASGPGGLAAKAVQTGSIVGGQMAGERLGEAVGHPEIGRFVGALLGPLAARGVTPFPQPSPRYAQDVETLAGHGIPLTPSRVTGSPFLGKLETALGSPTDETAAFTKAATRTTGSAASNPLEMETLPSGGAGNALKAQVERLKTGYDNFFGTRQIPYGNLSSDVDATVNAYKSKMGAQALPVVEDAAKMITLGKSGQPMANAQVAGMDGERYQALKGRLEDMIDSAGGPEKAALIDIKRKMEGALKQSMTPSEQKAFDQLNGQYANTRLLLGTSQGPGGEITPEALKSGAIKHAGMEGYNAGDVPEAGKLAQAGVNVLRPREEFSKDYMGNILGTAGIAGGASATLAGMPWENAAVTSILGGEAGRMAGPLVGHALRPVGRALYYNPLVQALLKNQLVPQAYDPSVMARVLASPPMTGQIGSAVQQAQQK